MASGQIFLSPPWMGGGERRAVAEAFASNYIAPCGPMVDRFEREFAAAVGLPHACALSSCTAAIDLLARELGVGRGDRVFCSDLTFIASVGPFAERGAEPVFIDAEPSSWTMDPGLLEEALRAAAAEGRLPKAVVAVDLYGQCCDYDRVGALAARYGVPLVVDSAEALGATYRGRSAGSAGMAAVFSFNGNKIITTSGGGMLASRDGDLVGRARKRSQQSREAAPWYEHAELGFNYRMSNVSAAIGVGQLEVLPEILRRKRAVFGRYRAGLGWDFMPEAAYGRCSRWLTVGLVPGAAGGARGEPSPRVMGLVRALAAARVEARPVWKPMHLQPVFAGARVYGGAVAERLFREGICLPSGAGLEAGDQARVIGLLGGASNKE